MAASNHHNEHEHRLRHFLKPRHIFSMISHLWSSDVNTEAVELLDPQPGERILDLGSGLGPATVETARHLGFKGRVIAVDPSAFMRTVLRARRIWQKNRKAVVVRAGTGENLPLNDNSIDGVLSLNVMHHLDNLTETAAELARVLRPGGRALLLDEDFGHHDHSFQSESEHHEPGPDLVEPGLMTEALTAAGFVDVDERATEVGSQPCFLVTARKPELA